VLQNFTGLSQVLFIQLAEDWVMKRIGKISRESLLSLDSVLRVNARTRRDEVNEKVTEKKNPKQRFEKKLEINSGLVTTFLRHKQAGYNLIVGSRKR